MERLQEEIELIREAGNILTAACPDGPAHPEDVEAAIRDLGSSNPMILLDIAHQLEMILMTMDENETQH